VAARLREQGIDVEQREGHYGEFTVLVDGEPVAKAGALSFIGVLPSSRTVLERIKQRIGG
jgi:hypothetical protein